MFYWQTVFWRREMVEELDASWNEYCLDLRKTYGDTDSVKNQITAEEKSYLEMRALAEQGKEFRRSLHIDVSHVIKQFKR